MPQLDLLEQPFIAGISELRDLPPNLHELIALAPLPGLGEGPTCATTAQGVQQFLKSSPNLRGTVSEAALWLLAGDLNRSHNVSQTLETREGSYWHGVMHRREGDFWNAKYWFRRVGNHPVFGQLAGYLESINEELVASDLPVADLTRVATLPATLVDRCEQAVKENSSQVPILQRICWFEWQFLFLYGWDN